MYVLSKEAWTEARRMTLNNKSWLEVINAAVQKDIDLGLLAPTTDPGMGPFRVIPFFDGYCVVKRTEVEGQAPMQDVYFMPEVKDHSQPESTAVASALNAYIKLAAAGGVEP